MCAWTASRSDDGSQRSCRCCTCARRKGVALGVLADLDAPQALHQDTDAAVRILEHLEDAHRRAAREEPAGIRTLVLRVLLSRDAEHAITGQRLLDHFERAGREISNGTMADGKMTTPRKGRMASSAGTAIPLKSSSKPKKRCSFGSSPPGSCSLMRRNVILPPHTDKGRSRNNFTQCRTDAAPI